ncbi:zinc-ribbon domain-containing protein [Streptomyces sp. NPDC017056]|uniref:zinc-ribbon domain-containing protein n=1 Tax=Streptomyces sp. NPDC017056 TaxID=3364973 RepID=UPI0037B41656
MGRGSAYRAWSQCPECGRDFEMTVFNRVRRSGCSFPRIAAELVPELDEGLAAVQVSAHSRRRLRWTCSRCGRTWSAVVSNGTRSHQDQPGCPLMQN